MIITVIFITLLPAWAACSGEGNIRLLEDEIAAALKACNYPSDTYNVKENIQRQRRSDDSYDFSPRIDDGMKQANRYGHGRRNTTDQTQVLNATDFEDCRLWDTSVTSAPGSVRNEESGNRTKRNEPLLNKGDTDQCLSQCVFANLQVVDSRGIPREAELWNRVQESVTSQQSRAALHDQIRACFQELQSEAEDNGCSYSNKLERCLMLRFSDRNTATKKNKQGTRQKALKNKQPKLYRHRQ